jgi:hypothetical protein
MPKAKMRKYQHGKNENKGRSPGFSGTLDSLGFLVLKAGASAHVPADPSPFQPYDDSQFKPDDALILPFDRWLDNLCPREHYLRQQSKRQHAAHPD